MDCFEITFVCFHPSISSLACPTSSSAKDRLSSPQTGNPHSEDRIAAFIKSANNLDSSSDAAVWLNSSRQPSLPNLMGNDSGVGADGVVVEGGSLGLGGDDGGGGPIPASTVSGGAVGSQKEENHAAVPSYHFRMDPHHCQLFTAMFRMAGNRQMGRGFSV